MQLSIKAEDLRKVKLFVGTPMYGGFAHGMYMKSCLDLQGICTKYGIECKFSFLFNESLITRARNYICDEFLRSEYTHLLFIDSDIHFNPEDILALLALDKDVIGAPYPKKSVNWGAVVKAMQKKFAEPDFDVTKFNPGELEGVTGEYVFNPVPGTTQFSVQEPLEVMEIGTGYMMVKHHVFGKFREEYPHLNYRPDHVGQANFDGSRYIHAFFDTVIDPDSHRYLSEDYMFCASRQTLVETEDGVKTIGKIVDTKYSGKVKSMKENGEVRWNKVVGWSKRKNEDKKWIKMISSSSNNRKSKLICTSDHKVAFFEDIFNPVLSYDKAENIKGKYVFRLVKGYENALYNNEQMQALLGTVLSDGHISKNNQLSFTHCFDQRNYHEHKVSLFGGTISETINRGFGKEKLSTNSWFPVNDQIKKLRELIYVDGKKTLKNVVDMLTPISLAYMYMDDGGLNRKSSGIHMGDYSEKDCTLLQNRLEKQYNIASKLYTKTVNYKNENRTYRVLSFDVENTEKFFDLIGHYVHPEMSYKMWKKYEYVELSEKRLQYSADYIADIQYLDNHHSMLYDIEVENDHNFFASGTLIHNCQYWRAIGGKVFLCPWMRTQHIGSYAFTGDMPAIAALTGSL